MDKQNEIKSIIASLEFRIEDMEFDMKEMKRKIDELKELFHE